MWYKAEIVIKSYLPSELEEGMLFVNRISVGVIEPYIELFELEELPKNKDVFMSKHGAPVELLIVDDDGELIASHDEIGWWDDGDDSDEYRDITLNDINYILKELDGYVDVEYDEVEDDFVIIEDKIILSIAQEKMWEEE